MLFGSLYQFFSPSVKWFVGYPADRKKKKQTNPGASVGGIKYTTVYFYISVLQRSWDTERADDIRDVEWPEAWLPVNTVLP